MSANIDSASYEATRNEAQQLIATNPQAVLVDITEVFEPYNLPRETLNNLTAHLADSPKLVDFVMQFQHCAEAPAASRAFVSALTIAFGYFLGGLLPLIPYFCVDKVYTGLYISIGVMIIALFVFGYVKTCIVIGWQGNRNIQKGCLGGIQMILVGSVAAGAAMGLVRAFNHSVDVDVR
jgi:VIT1/CCC1 family predicted Fe2+/Mn2+ transporter